MSLSRINAENVARHLVYAGTMMDENPEVAYEHAQAAYRHAARIDIVREALGLAAYVTGRYSEALRELRTYRRMTDDYTHVAIEADSERGLGRPEKALSFIAEVPMKKLDRDAQIELALVTSGARADAGDSEGGLAVLEKINPESLEESLRARFELIRADRLEELDRLDEANEIRQGWEPVFAAEGEVALYEDENEEGEEFEDLTDEPAEDADESLEDLAAVGSDVEDEADVDDLDEGSEDDPENVSSDEVLDEGDTLDEGESNTEDDDFYDVEVESEDLEAEFEDAADELLDDPKPETDDDQELA
ncbi:hypothetical protein VR010_12725 [Actinomycetaceae bacterium L2_0104]